MRRIAIGKHCSMHVEVNVGAPRAVCECRFMGAEATVGPLQVRGGGGSGVLCCVVSVVCVAVLCL